MTPEPDPCYCSQAQAYEAFINKIKDLLPDGGEGGDDLRQEADDLVNKYKKAQKEYAKCR